MILPSGSGDSGDTRHGQPDLNALLHAVRVIPVLGLAGPAEAEPMAAALHSGGMPLVEVTLRSTNALDCLSAMASQDDVIVGAGTVRTAAQLRQAADAGARFAVSPCLTPELAEAVWDVGLPFIPGVATATEIQLAVDAGFNRLKFFPAEASGGLAALAALAEPFPDVQFVPTGGVNAENAPAYLAHRAVLAVGGSWMVPGALTKAGDWSRVASLIREAARLGAGTP